MSTKKKSVFEVLSAINVNDKVEKKNGLTYLSWAWAWGEVKKVYPDAHYRIIKDTSTDAPYLFDQNLGYMVMTEVTIMGESLSMWLPVMDGANKSMRHEPYTYKVKDWYESKRLGKDTYKEKSVDAATMTDINKTLMRCLTKNLAMFGLGHYIFAGEDLPETNTSEVSSKTPTPKPLAKTTVKKTTAKKATAKKATTKEATTKQANLITLEVNDDNWAKVLRWVYANKSKGLDVIIKTLSQKYSIGKETATEIENQLIIIK